MFVFKNETPSLEAIRDFFYRADKDFDIPISHRVTIEEYTFKLYSYSNFYVCYDSDEIIGMICCYMNRPPEAYISYVCVSSKYQGQGVFSSLFEMLERECVCSSISKIKLEVNIDNLRAMRAYEKKGFVITETIRSSYIMTRELLDS